MIKKCNFIGPLVTMSTGYQYTVAPSFRQQQLLDQLELHLQICYCSVSVSEYCMIKEVEVCVTVQVHLNNDIVHTFTKLFTVAQFLHQNSKFFHLKSGLESSLGSMTFLCTFETSCLRLTIDEY